MRHLRKRLEVLRAVPYSPQQEGKIFFGAWVTLIDDDDNQLFFRIVGADEIAHHKDYSSVNSPIAKACLGKEIDDELFVRTDIASKRWYVDNIFYGTPEEVADKIPE